MKGKRWAGGEVLNRAWAVFLFAWGKKVLRGNAVAWAAWAWESEGEGESGLAVDFEFWPSTKTTGPKEMRGVGGGGRG